MNKRVWLIALAVVALVTIAILLVVQPRTGGPSKVVIGRILPLTGPAASYGKSEREGTLLALDEVNAAGGIGGNPLEIVFEDSHCSVKDGVNAMNKLVQVNKVPAVLGATISGITLAIAPIANEQKVLLLSPLSSVADITDAGPFVFRVMPSDAFQSRILADWIISDGHTNIAMLYVNNAWGKGVSEGFEHAFTKLGGALVAKEACKEGDRDFRTQLTKIREAKPSALFCPTMPQEGGKILRQLRELDITLPVYGADAWSADELLQGAGGLAEGVMYTYPSQFTGPEYQSFATAFRAKFGKEPDVNAAGAYDAVKILALCMNRVCDNRVPLTGNSIRQEMEKIKGYQGATGTTTFDENGDPVEKHFAKMVVRNGKRVAYDK